MSPDWPYVLHRDDWTNPFIEYGPQLPVLGTDESIAWNRRRHARP